MSYDLDVFGTLSLSARQLVDVLVEDRALHAQVDPGSGGISAVVRADSGELCFILDGPTRLEREDLPEGRPDLTRQRVQYSIFVTYDGQAEANTALALAFADRLAQRVKGTVVDWQTEPEPAAVPPPPPEPEYFLHLEWFRSLDDDSDAFAAHYVASAEEFFPRALPRTFGRWSPFAKFAKEGAAGVDRLYREECASQRMQISGRKPLLYGFLDEWSRAQIGEHQRLGLVFDASTLLKPRLAGAVEAFFVDLARRTDSFFACADVRRSRYGPPVAMAKWGEWTGLPRQAPWLSWFAPDYAALVQPHLTTGELRESDRGLLHVSRHSPAIPASASTEREPWIPEDFLPLQDDPDHRRLATATARIMPERLRSTNDLIRSR